MSIIPLATPLRVKVVKEDKDGKVLRRGPGSVVAWRVDRRVNRSHDGPDKLTPIVWLDSASWAETYDDPDTHVRYIGDQQPYASRPRTSV